MKNFNLFLFGLFSLILVSCGGGWSNQHDKITAYGILYSKSDLEEVSTKTLQGSVSPLGVCPAIELSQDSSRELCTENINYINDKNNPFGFDKSSDRNVDSFVTQAGVNNVSAYKITYNTPGQTFASSADSHPANEIVSGLVLIPKQTKIKGVVLYYHPTVLDKNSVPSAYFDFNHLGNQNTSFTAYNLATIYASQGYMVIAPDYVGQGDNSHVMHPYAVYPQVNALSGIYMLSAVKALLPQQSLLTTEQKLPLYISSYSEGGPYALWASRLLQGEYAGILAKNNLDLRLTVGISGAYNLTGEQLPFAYTKVDTSPKDQNIYHASSGLPFELANASSVGLANFNMAASKVVLASYVLTSFIHYNNNDDGNTYRELFNSSTSFLNMNHCLDLNEYIKNTSSDPKIGYCPINNVKLEALFTTPEYTAEAIRNQIIASAMGSHEDSSMNYFTSGKPLADVVSNLFSGPSNNSLGVLVKELPEYVTKKMMEADTWQFTTSSPITLIYMKYDSTVTNMNSLDALNGIKSQSGGVNGVQVKGIEIDNTKIYTDQPFKLYLEHGYAEFITNLAALAEINKDNQMINNSGAL